MTFLLYIRESILGSGKDGPVESNHRSVGTPLHVRYCLCEEHSENGHVAQCAHSFSTREARRRCSQMTLNSMTLSVSMDDLMEGKWKSTYRIYS